MSADDLQDVDSRYASCVQRKCVRKTLHTARDMLTSVYDIVCDHFFSACSSSFFVYPIRLEPVVVLYDTKGDRSLNDIGDSAEVCNRVRDDRESNIER